jgi:predicted peptidase
MYGLQKSLHDEQQYAYLLTLPNLYDAEPSQRWPLVLFLHGAGERGSNLNVIKVHGPPLLVSEGRKFPFILVSPQCPSNSSWNTAELSDLLDEIEAKYRVDTDRVYVTGLSMGGFGTYNLAMDEPTRFAAIAPMSSGADPDFASLLKGVPIWVFHGDKDPVVPIGGDRDMVTALKAQGADVTFTVIPNGKHDIWDPIYAGNEIYSWLLAHSLKR